jgi:hypothetical protein
MAIVRSGWLYVLGSLLLPVVTSGADLNRGDSPWQEIRFGKIEEFRSGTFLPERAFAEKDPPELASLGHSLFDGLEPQGDLNAGEEDVWDEKAFGSGTWSETSKPRMVDFSFGQPCGPLLWWEGADPGSSFDALANQMGPVPERTPEWGNLRKSANPSPGEPAVNMGMAILPLSLLGVFGLVVRRGY